MSNDNKINKRIEVGKTKVSKYPWEEERHVYNISEKNSIWADNIFIVIIQIIAFIVTWIYVYNNC